MIKKQRGTALIIAILLISAIGAVGFSFGRVFLAEFANARLHENSIIAFYSAESGIEEGFLRYRYSKNAEVPFVGWDVNAVLDTNRNYNLTNITASSIVSAGEGVNKTSLISTPGSDQFYYLRMGYAGTENKWPFFGQDTVAPSGILTDLDIADAAYGTGEFSYLTVAKDDSYKIDLSNVLSTTAKDINLFAKFIGSGSGPNSATKDKSFMEAKLVIDTFGDGNTVKEYKTMISADPRGTCLLISPNKVGDCADQVIQAVPINLSLPSGTFSWSVNGFLQLWRSRDGFPNIGPTSRVTLSIKPYYYGAAIGITSLDCAPSGTCEYDKSTAVPGPYTVVSSVGFYKNVYRTIEANIDRQSGSLYDLYDYVIYKANPN